MCQKQKIDAMNMLYSAYTSEKEGMGVDADTLPIDITSAMDESTTKEKKQIGT